MNISQKKLVATCAASALFLAAAATFLAGIAANSRTFIPNPVLKVVKSPEAAFDVWHNERMRGRILVLIDRRLNADSMPGSYDFRQGEFGSTTAMERFCNMLEYDLLQAGQPGFSCTIEGLNREILRQRSLYPLYLAKGPADPTGEIPKFAGYLSLTDDFAHDLPPGKTLIVKVNRLILQRAYPGLCPVVPVVTASNYVYRAILAGSVRKIYHLVSDSAWEEVSTVLASYAHIRASGPGFRFTIAEGVPVMVMRVQDMTALAEPPIVNVGTDSVGRDELAYLPSLITGSLHADLVTVSGARANELAAILGDRHAYQR